ncbi:MAG: glycosyltransferase [Bacteroidota bacterium]|nr:glycosyltransferase [Bacteroidota bacterium]
MLTIILIIAFVLYIAELFFLLIGVAKSNREKKIFSYLPKVSIIVAARNEEKVIGDCLTTLAEINYPTDKLEIIVVNDGSTDRTMDIIQRFAEQYQNIYSVVSVPGDGNLRGKTNAVAQGIAASSGDILMFTDADCRVPPTWVKETVKYFDQETGIVGGFTLLDSQRLFEGMQTLDWLFLFEIASGAAGWKVPLTVVGNNLAVRRSAYLATGGYAEIPFSVTEDYALVQAICRRTGYRVKFPMNIDTLVRSKACPTWESLYRQKQRWGVGGLDMVFYGIAIMSISWITKILMLISVPFIDTSIWFLIFLSMNVAEMLFLLKSLKCFRAIKQLQYFPAFAIYLFIYGLLIPFIAYFSSNVVWKERKFVE